MIFDLLWLDGHSLMDLPYEERRARLAELELDGDRWRTPDYVAGQGAAVLAATARAGPRGRRRQAAGLAVRAGPAQPGVGEGQERRPPGGRHRRLDAGGGAPPRPHRRAARRRARGRRTCATPAASAPASPRPSSTGSRELLGPLERDTLAVRRPRPDRRRRAGRSGSSRGYVAEVEFREWTQGGQMRAPSYKGLRDDKAPEEVVREAGASGDGLEIREEKDKAYAVVDGREIKLSNLDKVLYPKAGFRKRDVIAYYDDDRAVLLPHLEGRPLTLKRYPNGVDAAVLLREAGAVAPAGVGAHRARPDRVEDDRVRRLRRPRDARVARQPRRPRAAHVARARGGHPTARRRSRSTSTPASPRRSSSAAASALLLEGMFRGLGLQSFPKTSGSKGLQVYVPLNSADDLRRHEGLRQGGRRAARARGARSSSCRARRRRCAGARCSSTGARTTSTRRRSTSTRCGRASGRPCRRRSRGTRSARAPQRGDPERLVFDADAVRARVEEHGDLFAPGRVACAAASRGLTLARAMRRRRRTLRELLAELRFSPDDGGADARAGTAWRRSSTTSAARAMPSASARRRRSRPSDAAGTTFSRRTKTSRPPRPACSPGAGTAGCSSGSRGR